MVVMKQRAFTLIELSIVLVVIGLLVGGVLVGQDLIAAAKLRATVSQIESYKVAVNTFKLKYDDLPGDMPPVKAAQFGLFTITGNCGSTCPFDDEILSGGGSPINIEERYVFWRHLSEASLIETMNSSLLQTSTGRTSSTPAGWQKGILPESPYFPNYHWLLFGPGFQFFPNGSTGSTGQNAFNLYGPASPAQSYALDSKIDDGKPNTGKMYDENGPAYGRWAATAADPNCTYGGADRYSPDALYILDEDNGANTGFCGIHIKAGF